MKAAFGIILVMCVTFSLAEAQAIRSTAPDPLRVQPWKSISLDFYGGYPGMDRDVFSFYPGLYAYDAAFTLPFFFFWNAWYPADPLYFFRVNPELPQHTYHDPDDAPVWEPIGYQVYDWCGSSRPVRPRDPLTKKVISTPAEREEHFSLGIQ